MAQKTSVLSCRWVRILLGSVFLALMVSCQAGGPFAPTSGTTQVRCIPQPCASGAVFDGPLDLQGQKPDAVVVTVVRNGVKAHIGLRNTTPGLFEARIVGPLPVQIRLETQPLRLWVHIFNRPEYLLDGDEYVLTVAAEKDVLLERIVAWARYQRTAVQDANCPEPCVSLAL